MLVVLYGISPLYFHPTQYTHPHIILFWFFKKLLVITFLQADLLCPCDQFSLWKARVKQIELLLYFCRYQVHCGLPNKSSLLFVTQLSCARFPNTYYFVQAINKLYSRMLQMFVIRDFYSHQTGRKILVFWCYAHVFCIRHLSTWTEP